MRKFLIGILFLIFPFGFAFSLITDYQSTFIPCFNQKNELRIAIRIYYNNNIPYFLVVNPYTFDTETAPVNQFQHRKLNSKDKIHSYLMQELQATPYIKALTQYTSPPYKTENYGMTQANYPLNGQFLTIDMCPSIRVFEAAFFNALVAKADQLGRPIPIGISITGLWILHHPTEFAWITQQELRHKFKITWINHTFSHIYFSDLPLKNNFLLIPGINVTQEILMTEKLLLEKQQMPSVFFRFPGLISNKDLILKLRELGLIPIGSSAWLGYGDVNKPGGIILIHGNSNQTRGVQALLPVLPSLNLLPLNQAFH